MNAEFFEAIEDIEKEKGIPRSYMYDKIKQAMLAAFRRDNPECGDNVEILLDEEDPIPDSYVFEVGSAGAERELKRPSDFEQFMGSQVEVRLYQPVKGSKTFVGTLAGYDQGKVTVTVGKETMTFEKAQTAQVRLHVTI